nr:hypothetical protein P5626_08415 [Bacillus subtilis]
MSEQDVTHQQTKVLLPAIPLLAMTPRDAFYANTEVIPLKEASGRIIAEFVMVYPPIVFQSSFQEKLLQKKTSATFLKTLTQASLFKDLRTRLYIRSESSKNKKQFNKK